jgi:tetratricopeptide (TPR) repeat protein
MKRFQDAVETYQKALGLLKERSGINDEQYFARTLNNLSLAYCELGQTKKAIESSQMALKTFQKINGDDDISVANCLSNLGLRYISANEYEKGLGLMREALEKFERLSNFDMMAKVLNNTGDAALFLSYRK